MTRDLSDAQFKRAAKAAGFRPLLLWLEDISGETRASYGMVMDRTGKVLRRTSLAHACAARRYNAKA